MGLDGGVGVSLERGTGGVGERESRLRVCVEFSQWGL
jgi:hypothetical protein